MADTDNLTADVAEAHAEIERLTSLVGYWEHRAEELTEERDRYAAAWRSARRRARSLRAAWRYARYTVNAWRREARATGDALRALLEASAEHVASRDRYRLAWTSARRRAADEANFGMEAMALKDAHLAALRREIDRLRAFAADVTAVRDWTMCAATPRDLLESHLRPIYDSMYELEAAEREGRPFIDRLHRRAARGEFDD
ncbi:hypothetical protein [Streptomyces sp. NPDC056061]|uniref:hypothetical protein n=1 Tax=Streptomyces sp. NPDC056061 TaxID=3345700 RepID=UPI0035DAF0BB